MEESIKKEQEKLTKYLKNLTKDELEKQGIAIMGYIHGFEAGMESAKKRKDTK